MYLLSCQWQMLNVRNCIEKLFEKARWRVGIAKDEKLSWDHDTHRIQCVYANKQQTLTA